ncbi:hypothetical protein ACEN33_00680 [Ruoffia sp. FAM 24228]|uniref:phage scaffolding protein n=1 Tax=Ruoffia sp. FAM 24228 TaxID=3259517 RepID=UPI003885B024
MKRDYLLNELELSKEVVDKIFAEHGQALNAEKQKHEEAVEALQTKLDEANETISKASESKEGLEQIQSELEDYKTKYEEAQATLDSERKTQKVKEALTAKGGQDTEYLMFKLGEVEDVEKVDELVDKLKEELPSHFGTQTEVKEDKKEDVEIISKPLEKGDSNKTYSFDELSNLSTEEINSNWSLISESLSNQ